MTVYVITLNDSPEGVRATQEAAEEFVEARRELWVERRGANREMLHFRIHTFHMPEAGDAADC